MKKYIAIILAVVMAAIMVLPCAATETVSEMPTEAISEAVSESVAVTEGVTTEVITTEAAESVVTEVMTELMTDAIAGVVTEVVETDVVTEIEVNIDIGEVHDIIENSSSFAEAVIAIADRFGISIEDAEKLVGDMKALGDKYLGESEMWEIIKNDMAQNPGKYVVIALVILIIVAIIGFMLKWIVSNIGQIRALKMDVRGIKNSIEGDENGEGKATSLRGLITAKNDEIKALKDKDAALEAEVIKLREEAARLTIEAGEVKKNTESALTVTQETALQIAQLLYIALDKGKMPVVSSEAKKIWYENFQSKIKATIGEGGEPDAETSEEVQNV